MAYQKPLCDCGKELNYEVEEIQVMTYRILKNGIISKKPIHKGLRTENIFGNLVCPSCQKRFEFNARIKRPNKFKAIRGEEI